MAWRVLGKNQKGIRGDTSMKCKINGCEKEVGKHGAKGMCPKHYNRWRIERSDRKCLVEGCCAPVWAKGFCAVHYNQNRLHGKITNKSIKKHVKQNVTCSVAGCNKKPKSNNLCPGHLWQYKAYGKIVYKDLITKRNNNPSHPLYHTWQNMKDRCYNPNNSGYNNYGGRGIKVCDRWLNRSNGFNNFVKDMGDKPENTTLDRKDNNGDYCPENCRWATYVEQGLNKRTNLCEPYISVVYINGVKYFAVRIKDLYRDKGKVWTKHTRTLDDAIIAREQILNKMKKIGAR